MRSQTSKPGFYALTAALCLLGIATGPAQAKPLCARDLWRRTPEQTIREHIALIQQGRIDEAMCDYAENATVILPGQVVTGLENIRIGLDGIGALLGDAVPQIQTLTAHGPTVLLTFSAFGSPCTIPDGSDTYVVVLGKILVQTVHDTFYSAPGAICPLAP